MKAWFKSKKWKPFQFQEDTWQAYSEMKSGLIHATTGTGKTYAIWLATLIDWINNNPDFKNKEYKKDIPLTVLWITPLRALAQDTKNALELPVKEMGLPWSVGIRTGDTPSSVRQKQKKRMPTCLITTPESLSLLLTYKNASEMFTGVEAIVVDEWHELLSSKRGVMTELVLARMRELNPELRIWGLSATLGNTEEAMNALVGVKNKNTALIKGVIPKELEIIPVIPDEIERFPMAGHLGIKLLPKVVELIKSAESVLVFTNTRSQTEIWFQEILSFAPELAGEIALHHGSLDKGTRNFVESGLRDGSMKCVVCTSSLDLGVDFSPVDRVIQIGSIKGIARLLQRAGRSGHSPGKTSKIIFVPTNSLELIEIAAVKDAVEAGKIEPRVPIEKPLDLLAQHLITIAIGEGFDYISMLREIRTTYSFRNITEQEYNWVLNFIVRGGESLQAYPEYSKVVEDNGHYTVESKKISMRHRMSVGVITSDNVVRVKFIKGSTIGTIEESFISKMEKGDNFVFGGRLLEFVSFKDMTVYVRIAKKSKGQIPQWMGGRMPLSTELSDAVREKLEEIKQGDITQKEIQSLAPIIDLQKKWSIMPGKHELLIEKLKQRSRYHVFIYPFEGYLVHEGLAALIAYRISKDTPITLSLSVNDYGIEFHSDKPIPIEDYMNVDLFNTETLADDILESVNSAEMAKRQFREIARVAGLIFTGYPGSNKSTKQLQASSGLFFDVFKKYDPDNLLYKQAFKEVLDNQLEYRRIKEALDRMAKAEKKLIESKYATPLAFPLIANSLRSRLSSEKVADRIKRMKERLEKAAEK